MINNISCQNNICKPCVNVTERLLVLSPHALELKKTLMCFDHIPDVTFKIFIHLCCMY